MALQIETKRLLMREITPADGADLYRIMNSSGVRKIWEHAFSEEDIRQWMESRMAGYAAHGMDHLLLLEKESGKAVGQCGILYETVNGKSFWGIGWILQDDAQGKGYATEAAMAVADYGFDCMGLEEIFADIRPENEKSLAVARRLGMEQIGSLVKHYRGKDMEHLLFSLKKQNRSWHTQK